MELRRLWSLVWSRKLLIGVMVLAALAAGWAATPRTARYQSTAELFVGLPQYSTSADQQFGLQLVASTFASIATDFTTAQNALALTGVSRTPTQVMQETRASVVAATTLVHISVTDEDPVVAQSLANGVSQAFVARVKDLIKSTTTSTGSVTSTPPVSIAEPANLPVAPLSNGLGRDLTLSGIFGLLAGIALVLLLDYLDLSVRTPEDLERKIGLPLLGVIPLFPDLSERQSLIGGTAIRRPDRTLERLDG